MDSVEWPPQLLEVLRAHMIAVEDPAAPSIPPVYTATSNIYDFFMDHTAVLQDRMTARGFDADVTSSCTNFILETLEHCCPLSFLLSRERRIIATAARARQKKSTAPLSVVAVPAKPGARKRNKTEGEDGGGSPFVFTRVLTLEYLLRLFVAMPLVLEHYDRLGGATMPAYCKRPLWVFVNITLTLVESCADRLCPLSTYIPMR